METNVKLYSLGFNDVHTYLAATLFVACNVALPQLFHLIPQGGIIFAPLSLVILVGAYKFGWKAGVLAAVASPITNHLLFGMPSWGVLQVMALKLAILALAAGLTARYSNKVTIPLLAFAVLASELIGGLGELAITGGLGATIADFTLGWPGLLLQIVGGYLAIRLIPTA